MTDILKYEISLDCAPGYYRPGDYIDGVIEGTGLPQQSPVSKFFGNWTWDYSGVPNIAVIWERHRQTMFERTKVLYEAGKIRYSEVTLGK